MQKKKGKSLLENKKIRSNLIDLFIEIIGIISDLVPYLLFLALIEMLIHFNDILSYLSK